MRVPLFRLISESGRWRDAYGKTVVNCSRRFVRSADAYTVKSSAGRSPRVV